MNLLLEEYKPETYPLDRISMEMGTQIWRRYSPQIGIEFPTPITENRWKLTNQGWVGLLPLANGDRINLLPKIPLTNLFGMMEYAYGLHFLQGLVESDGIEEFFNRLAQTLARMVLQRERKGYHRTYLNEQEYLPFIRGKMDANQLIRQPWNPNFNCQYEDHTSDIEDNQILAWTLHGITRSGLCRPEVTPTVRKAYHSALSCSSLRSFQPEICLDRLYHRLNADYQPLHALCRFFLDHTGPTHNQGDRSTLPFLVNMPLLFERFVAEWLRLHLPKEWHVKKQEKYRVSEKSALNFRIDLVLYNLESNRAVCVLDTKYKTVANPSSDDIAQIVAYAEAKRCREGILVYPAPLEYPLDVWIGTIHVRSLVFDLREDFEIAGNRFLSHLFGASISSSELPLRMS